VRDLPNVHHSRIYQREGKRRTEQGKAPPERSIRAGLKSRKRCGGKGCFRATQRSRFTKVPEGTSGA